MSLINDALKTAQRERTGRTPQGSGGSPLVDGFFPYIASSAAKQGPSRQRVILLSVAGGIVVVAAIAFGVPFIRQAFNKSSPSSMAGPPAGPSIVQAPAAVASDSQAAAPPVAVAEEPPVTTPVDASEKPRTHTRLKSVAGPELQTATRSDSAAPSIAPAPLSTSPAAIPATPRRANYELEGNSLFTSGDYAAARDRFKLAIASQPTASAWTNYGVTLLMLGDTVQAMGAYRSAFGIDGNYFPAWLLLGRAYKALNDIQNATPAFQRARSINPADTDVNTELADLEYRDKNWTETRRFAVEALRGDPANWRAHYFNAVAADALLDRETAVTEYEAYIATIGAAAKDNAQAVGWARSRLQVLKGKP